MSGASARGRAARLHVASKPALVTPASGGWQALTFYSENLNRSNDLPDDNELGAGYENERDATDPGPGLPSGSGTITVPADLNQLWFWLNQLLGAPDSDVDEGVHTHVFVSGKPDLPFMDLDIPMTGGRFKQAACAVNEFSFGVAKEDGYRRFSFALLARDVATPAAAVAVTPAALPARAKLPASKGIVRINDTIAGNLIGGEFTYSNNLEPEMYADDTDTVGHFAPGDGTLTGSPRFRFKRGSSANGALDVFADHETPFKLEVEYRLGANAALILEMARCFGPKVIPPIEGAGAIDFTGNFTARQSASAPLLKATLVNAVASVPAA